MGSTKSRTEAALSIATAGFAAIACWPWQCGLKERLFLSLSLSCCLSVFLSFSLRVHSSMTFYVRAVSATGCARVGVAQRSATSVQETHGKKNAQTHTHACEGAHRILAWFKRQYIKPMLT